MPDPLGTAAPAGEPASVPVNQLRRLLQRLLPRQQPQRLLPENQHPPVLLLRSRLNRDKQEVSNSLRN
jgi:hypothetical protein